MTEDKQQKFTAKVRRGLVWVHAVAGAELAKKKAEREAFLREQELKAKQEAEEHRRREIERRMHPRTAADFEILYNELEAWRLQVGSWSDICCPACPCPFLLPSH